MGAIDSAHVVVTAVYNARVKAQRPAQALVCPLRQPAREASPFRRADQFRGSLGSVLG